MQLCLIKLSVILEINPYVISLFFFFNKRIIAATSHFEGMSAICVYTHTHTHTHREKKFLKMVSNYGRVLLLKTRTADQSASSVDG